jgi:hypothetical protein
MVRKKKHPPLQGGNRPADRTGQGNDKYRLIPRCSGGGSCKPHLTKAKQRTPLLLRRSQYQIYPSHPAPVRQAMTTSIDHHGVEQPTTWDDQGNLLDGWERETICAEKGINCPREVRHFDTEADKFRFILAVNAHRRPSLNQKQKREVIAAYLQGDPAVADNLLGESLGGSKNTVLAMRQRLEASGKIRKVKKTRGKDGKVRPVRYTKRIITNTPGEFQKAQEIIKDLPPDCAGKTLDLTTARRRARRARSHLVRAARAANSHPLPDSIRLYHCRFQDLGYVAGIAPESVNNIITDIPYENAFLPQVADLGNFAARFLMPGGLLLMMSGIQHLDDILSQLKQQTELTLVSKLEMTWDKNTGMPIPIGRHGMMISASKPIWVYSKGPFTRKGKFVTPQGPFCKEKHWHPHQQPLDMFMHLVTEYTDPGDLIVDPCGGGFTTAEACFRLGRKCISCDVDDDCVNRGQERLDLCRKQMQKGA